MDLLTIGADIGAMIVGLPVISAGIVWLLRRRDAKRQLKAETALRNWDGYIMVNNINSWYVRLIDDPKTPTAVVPIEIVDREGNPDSQMAYNLRQVIIRDGMLARVPTEREYAFLKHLNKANGYGKGGLIT
jgi:hypothetical protein